MTVLLVSNRRSRYHELTIALKTRIQRRAKIIARDRSETSRESRFSIENHSSRTFLVILGIY